MPMAASFIKSFDARAEKGTVLYPHKLARCDVRRIYSSHISVLVVMGSDKAKDIALKYTAQLPTACTLRETDSSTT